MVHTRQKRNRRSGATTVETALVISLFVLLIFAVYEYGRLVMMKHLLDNAAREGARYAVVHTYDKTTADVQSWVHNYLAGQEAHLKNVKIAVFLADSAGKNTGTWTNSQFGDYISVQIDGDYSPVLPSLLFMSASVHLQSNSTMFSEAN